jgi:hypothetical protein
MNIERMVNFIWLVCCYYLILLLWQHKANYHRLSAITNSSEPFFTVTVLSEMGYELEIDRAVKRSDKKAVVAVVWGVGFGLCYLLIDVSHKAIAASCKSIAAICKSIAAICKSIAAIYKSIADLCKLIAATYKSIDAPYKSIDGV